MMAVKTKWEKEELLKILNDDRRILRCDLQRKLKVEKANITKDIDVEIKELEKKRNAILKKHNLINIDGSNYGCLLHPELKMFDENTNIARKQILKG
jgi:hypothetical protein